MKRLLLLLLCLLSIPCMGASRDELNQEFGRINEQRERRLELIQFLKAGGKTRENTRGILNPSQEKDAQATIEAENQNRLRQFEIVAEFEGKTKEQVAQEFARKMGVLPDSDQPKVVLRLHGSNTIGATLAPELIRAWLQQRGAADIGIGKDGVGSTVLYRESSSDTDRKAIEIQAHGTSTAFVSNAQQPQCGIAEGHCDLGMASRAIKKDEAEIVMKAGRGDLRENGCVYPIAVDGVAVLVHPQNDIHELTVEQLARIFSGTIANWSELGGPDQPIRIHARDEHSGTFDSFDSKVLKPFKCKIAPNAKRYEDSRALAQAVAQDPFAIGFAGIAYLNNSVAGVAVRDGKNARALLPSRLTIKTLDYPLSRLLFLYAPRERSTMAVEFLNFAMSDRGQAVVDTLGMVGQGVALQTDRQEADLHKKNLLTDASAPEEYKILIANADRRDTQANIRFDFAKPVPDVNSLQNLQRAANLLASPGHENDEVLCLGFTDDQGSQKANLDVSIARAHSVAEQLRLLGVKRVTPAGFGEALPVADNATEEGRAINRRVELWIRR